jgi:ssDNA thymidine ADP-ribosyltransferase, DarT
MKVTRAELTAHVAKWASAPAHTAAPWIPKYVYHFTDINNAVSILRTGELLSRSEALARKLMSHDNASAQVIAATSAAHLDFVRMYFRPRTPTQYYNEGIRPAAKRPFDNAHCPVPIFFVFDLVETLSLPGTQFSDRSMAVSGATHDDTSALFSQIPFDLVYHEGPIDTALRARNVIQHRHAEVLAPRSLKLDTLRWIGCRSHAERESLLCLLGNDRPTWETRVSVALQRLFLRGGCCVESAALDATGHIQFGLHIPHGWSIKVRFELVSETSGKTWHWQSDSWTSPTLRLGVKDLEPGLIKVHIEDCLAYVARAQPADAPF